MKSFGAYISKHLASFTAFILMLLFINGVIFGMTFHKTFTVDYGENSPHIMLEMTAAAISQTGISEEAKQKLHQNNIWAIYLDQNGQSLWSIDLPEEVPESYTIQDVALFSKGYIADYPVFVWNTDDGLLVLGYPKGSYTKLTSNYYSVRSIKTLPFFIIGMLATDLLLLFGAYYHSKRKILRNTEPIVATVETLSNGKPISLRVRGELSGIAESLNKASRILSKQNQARANWISGVSHDIRTPLSIIMGYAEKMAGDKSASCSIREQAKIVRKQSNTIKELVQDLNLVSQLEYEMQPLHKEEVRLSKIIRSYVAELLNAGISETYTIEIDIVPGAETAVLECDARLISRAVNNLVQNSIKHNPQGCEIRIILEDVENFLLLTVADNGVGLSPEKLHELEEKPHYMESTDDRLDLRHGLGLILVRQIVEAHNGLMTIESTLQHGCKTVMNFPK
ncbi:sensor histidine kinase [Frisingicoccus sp.]|uniref:sensor histidine kinase n=1 Tax=Frisingicoccus sp. TaxID=1918627 RepID=UPI003AB7DED5